MRHPATGAVMYFYTYETEGAAYGLVYHDYPTQLARNSQALLSGEKKGYVNLYVSRLLGETPINVSGWAGIDVQYEAEVDGHTFRGGRRFVLVDSRMYTFYCTGPKETMTPDLIAGFLNSFELE